jgi:hypothetical protein
MIYHLHQSQHLIAKYVKNMRYKVGSSGIHQQQKSEMRRKAKKHSRSLKQTK